MGHLTQDELRAIVDNAAKEVAVGAQYRHYKGDTYTVLAIALIEATNEPAIVYRAEYGEGIAFIRPLSDWRATVEYEGAHTQRFTKIGV